MKTTNNKLEHKNCQLVANNIMLILQLKFDQLFGVPIEQLSPME
jgi:hypothetical protein